MVSCKVGVIVPTLTNKGGGYDALASIKGTDEISWTPIILDNWRKNRSIAQSWNEGINIAIDIMCDMVLIINDDILFAPHTLQGLCESWRARPNGVIMVTGRNIKAECDYPEDILRWQAPLNRPEDAYDGPDFSCFMTAPDIISKVGTFDENFYPGYFEDNDYHTRIKLLGYRTANTSWAPYYHFGSITQNYYENLPVVTSPAFEDNRQYYKNKWGGIPGEELFKNPYNDPELTPSMWLPNMR
jgi:hypothetical protein